MIYLNMRLFTQWCLRRRAWQIDSLSATLHRRPVINTPGSNYREDPW